MTFKDRYEKGKNNLLSDQSICIDNRELFKKFFEYEEVKLKRINGLSQVDERSYKTLYSYIRKFRNVNSWFNNKPWKHLVKEDIEKVYNDLEDGKIKNNNGNSMKALNKSYYASVFKSKPFELAGKKEIANEVIQYYSKDESEVKFIEEDIFRKIVDVAISLKQKCLLWIAWDIGENIGSLLELRKKDFLRQENRDSKEIEYRVNLSREILKRSRTPRSELTNYKETADFLDIILKEKNDDYKLFDFGIKQAEKYLRRAANIIDANCIPNGKRVTWKDLRSSMACHLLKIGWSRDEINARLGHKPSSRVLDKYINFLALDRYKPKKVIYENSLRELQTAVEKSKEIEKLQSQRIESIRKDKELGEERIRLLEMKINELENIKSISEDLLAVMVKNKKELMLVGNKVTENNYVKRIFKPLN